MALCYLPCFGEARLLCRSGISVPRSTGNNDKRLGFLCSTTCTWSINVKRYQARRLRHGVSLPFQMNVKQATRTSHMARILIPTASVAQSNRPAVRSEERTLGSLLTFSYAASVVRREDEDADGGRALGSNSSSSSSSSSSIDADSRERMRRDRIARANKGRVPWNKGRRHSPETIVKITERTRIAMQNPMIRDKLRMNGKNQTVETKAKIRKKMVGYWERKRIVKETQASWVNEWKEVIAEAARVGSSGDEEFEWDTFKKMKEQYRLEDLRAASKMKSALRAARNIDRERKPVSEAHRKAISDAIRAKWADPEYQANVFAGMAKVDVDKRQKSRTTSIAKAKPVPRKTTPRKSAPRKSAKKPLPFVEVVTKPPQVVPVDEGFLAEVLAEEDTLLTRRKRAIAARTKEPRKVTLVRLEDHNLSSRDHMEATGRVERRLGREELRAAEGPLTEADVRAPIAGPGDVQLSSKLSLHSCQDPLVLEKVRRIQQLRQGRLELESKRKEAADRARILVANAERAANALEQAGNADAAMLDTLREAQRILAEATRSVQAAELKSGSSSDSSALRGSPRSMQSGRSGGFHRRMWTEGDSLEDCPHPIPMRRGEFPFRDDQPPLVPHLDDLGALPTSSVRAVSPVGVMGEGDAEEGAEGPSPSSAGLRGEADRVSSVVRGGSGSNGSAKSSISAGGTKKRWHRGRLVFVNDDERT